MFTDRIVLFLAPVALFLLWLILSRLFNKSPSRFSVNVVLSLLLLIYFIAVAATGIFWVAAQELPIFDWHYLLGYILLLLCIVHVVLNWKPIALWLRGRSPKALKDEEGKGFKPSVKTLSLIVLLGAIGWCIFLAGSRFGSETVSVVIPSQNVAPSPEHVDAKTNHASPEAMDQTRLLPLPSKEMEVDDKTMTLAQFYHWGCAYPARSSLSGITWEERPPVYKTYDDVKETALPDIKPEGGGPFIEASEKWRNTGARLAESTMSLEDLALLLHHTQGINKVLEFPGRKFELRTAPSAGALYPVDIYLVINRVDGIEAGLYHYHVQKHSLQQLKTGAFYPVLEQAAGCPHAYQPAAATVIMSVVFSRTGFKYRDRCYRYVNMDTGHAVGNLCVCAGSLGLAAPVVARFDDEEINRFLEIDAKEEAALVLVPLGRPVEESDARNFAEPGFESSGLALPESGGTDYLSLIHGGTGMKINARWRESPDFGQASVAIASYTADTNAQHIQLPEPTHGDDLYPVIRRRRSIRNHAEAPMRLHELSALCVAAAGTGSPSEPFLSMTGPLNLYAMVRDVEGLQPGVYLFHPESRSLSLVREGDLSKDTFEASYRQDFCGTADVVFIKTIDWKAMTWPDGDRGYRYACIRSGIMGNGLYLQATALGLGPCGVGAFLDDDAAALIGLDTAEEAVLYLTAVGR